MEFYCYLHPRFHPIYLKLDDSNKVFFKCAKCITEFKLSGDELILVEEVNSSDDNSIIYNWPPVTNYSLIEQISEVINRESDTSQIKKLDSFFQQFKQELNEQLNTIHQIVTSQIDKYQNSSKKVLEVYNKLSEKFALKELMLSEISQKNKNKQFIEFIQNKIENKEINSKELEKAIIKYNENVQEINLEIPLKLKQDILHSLEKVSLYFEEDDQIINEINQSSKIMSHCNQEGCFQKFTNVDILLSMISNKSNFCNEQYLQKIKYIFNKYSVLINKEADLQSPYLTDKLSIDFSNLTEQQLEDIRILAQFYSHKNQQEKENQNYKYESQINQIIEFIQNRTNFISKQSISKLRQAFEKVEPFFQDVVQADKKQIDFNGISQENFNLIIKQVEKFKDESYMKQPSENVTQIMKLISNSTNFVRPNFLNEIESQLNKMKCVVDELNFNNDNFLNSPIDFEYVSYDQLQNINELAMKYSQTNLACPSKSSKAPHYLELDQSNNTFIVLQYIDFKFFNEADKEKIKNILIKYPILELIDIANPYKDLTQEVNFVASQYNNSDRNVKIYRNHQRELVLNHYQFQNQSYQTLFDSILDPSLKYIVRIEIDPMNNFNYYSRIGLIRQSIKNTHRIFADNMCFCNQNSYGVTKVIKGKKLNDPSIRFSLKTRNLEFRIWIKGRVFIVTDFPYYHNINSIEDDSKEIELYPSLTLGTLGFNIKNFIIKYFKVVEHFPQY